MKQEGDTAIPLLESKVEIMLSCSTNGKYYRNNPVEYS